MYLVGRRRSPHVHDYRDFLERNRVRFRWVDVDRNPLVRHLGGARELRQSSLPFFLFSDGSYSALEPGRTQSWRSCAHESSSRRASACTRGPTRSCTTS